MSKELAEAKLELGRAKKVLWQYRNKDIEEFEYIDAITYVEECTKQVMVKALKEEVEERQVDDSDHDQGVQGWNSAIREVLNLITDLEE